MANLLNDTDPQSPRAFSRTDPGIGDAQDSREVPDHDGSPSERSRSPKPLAAVGAASASASGLAVTPSAPSQNRPALAPAAVPLLTPSPPASESIEALLDGITGPRPPPPASRRGEIGPAADRVYAAARPAPASQPTAAPEPPLVVSPEPARVAPAEPPPAGGQVSAANEATRPVARRARDEPTLRQRRKEEKTVFTGRRAVIRNATVMILSASIVAVLMMSILRWRERRPAERAAAAGTPPPQPDPPPVQPSAPATVAASDNDPAQAAPAQASAPAPPATGKSPAPARHSRGDRGRSTQQNSLDDLNRQIRH